MALAKGYRRVGPAAGGAAPAAAVDEKVFKAYPTLQSFLREVEWDDGSKRETATLLIFTEEGRWKGMLNDRDAGCVAFVSAETAAGVLAALEKGLDAGTLDWRASKQQGTRGKRA